MKTRIKIALATMLFFFVISFGGLVMDWLWR